jgi:hypothetical protein
VEVSPADEVATPELPGRTDAATRLSGRHWLSLLAGPQPGAGRRFPAAVGVGSFLVLAAVLLVRNAYLFTTKIYENADFAANTIAVLQAKHFQLLTGNYSKDDFYHPGPAFLYVMAAGESLFHDALHVVPTPWNGQLLGILLLNAVLVAAAIALLAAHAGSRRPALAGLVVVLVFVAVHPLAVNSDWMPYVYFAPALLLLVSGASVATGRTASLPLLALSAWLCIHGQAEFLVFAPATVVLSLGGLVAAHRQDLRGMVRGNAWHWVSAGVVTALFALPIVIYTARHWPGQFGLYLKYRENVSAHHLIHHSLSFSVGYTLRYWWPGIPAPAADIGGCVVAGALVTVALLLALRCPVPSLRRFLLWSLAMAGLMTLLFVYFAQTAIADNEIKQSYVGYFYWAAPLVVLIVAAAGAAAYLPRRRTAAVALVVAAAAAAVIATVAPHHLDNPNDPPAKYLGVPQLPQLVHTLATVEDGRPIVLRINHGAWFDAVGVVAYADRTGVRSCVVGSKQWGVLFRSQSICTPSEIQTGVPFWFSPGGQPVVKGQVAVARLPQTLVTRPTT